MTRRPKHWWWQVLSGKEISLAGTKTSLEGEFDVTNKRGGILRRCALKVVPETYATYSRASDSLREMTSDVLYLVTRDGWEFPVPRDAFIERSGAAKTG